MNILTKEWVDWRNSETIDLVTFEFDMLPMNSKYAEHHGDLVWLAQYVPQMRTCILLILLLSVLIIVGNVS